MSASATAAVVSVTTVPTLLTTAAATVTTGAATVTASSATQTCCRSVDQQRDVREKVHQTVKLATSTRPYEANQPLFLLPHSPPPRKTNLRVPLPAWLLLSPPPLPPLLVPVPLPLPLPPESSTDIMQPKSSLFFVSRRAASPSCEFSNSRKANPGGCRATHT